LSKRAFPARRNTLEALAMAPEQFPLRQSHVMLVLDTGIQILSDRFKSWIAGSSPAMTLWIAVPPEWNLL